MRAADYKSQIKGLGASKRLGQNFLINGRIAKTEANFGIGRNVLELGPGLGVLTSELCKVGKMIVAVEKDERVCEILKENVRSRKLRIINSDFFKTGEKFPDADIMISNIPYNLSSKVLAWLGDRQMPAVLCLQKEFVGHMLAKPSERNYSRLSVFSSLQFAITYIMDVPANDFYPMPKVNSSLVYLKPKKLAISREVYGILALLMMHKKKKIRNALVNSSKTLGMDKHSLSSVAESLSRKDSRPFQLGPEELLEVADEIAKRLK
jgi:16S rRNA (adenine1518-N6/adenine1519-N6)-dimethyltransferase